MAPASTSPVRRRGRTSRARMRPKNSKRPMPAARATRATPRAGGPRKNAARRAGRVTMAVPTRRARLPRKSGVWIMGGERSCASVEPSNGVDPAVTPFALLVVDDGLKEVSPAEVRPQHVGDPDLDVGDLPEEEVRDPELAARADQEVGVGLSGGVEVGGERRLVDLRRVPSVGQDVLQEPARRVGDLGPASVVEGDVEEEARVGRGPLHTPLQLPLDVPGQVLGAPDDLEADVVLEEGLELRAQVV